MNTLVNFLLSPLPIHPIKMDFLTCFSKTKLENVVTCKTGLVAMSKMPSKIAMLQEPLVARTHQKSMARSWKTKSRVDR